MAEVVLPTENKTVSASILAPSALSELEGEGIFVLFNEDGNPYGFIQNNTFVESIKYGNLTILPYEEGATAIIGGGDLEELAEEVASVRSQLGESFDQRLLREEDFLEYVYNNQRYDGLVDYLKEMGLDNKQTAIDYMNSLQPNIANEFLNIYDAAKLGEVGYSQYAEILNALNELNGEDLSKYLNQELIDAVNKKLDEFKKEISEEMLKDLLKNLDSRELKILKELIKNLNYETIYQIARDYLRDAARDGSLDNALESLKDEEIPDDIKNEAMSSTSEFLKTHLTDFLPKKASYYAFAFSIIAFTLILRRIGG